MIAGTGSGGRGEVAVLAEGLTRRFSGRVVVDGIDLRVRAGEFYGFLGPNGAGKSTTIRMLTGLLRPDSGRAVVAGHDVVREPLAVKARIGVLPEDSVLYERLTGRENLEFSGRMYGLDWETIEARSRDLLRLMGMSDDDADRLVIDYSTGMRKKIGLACALIHRPRVLFLDEPFNGLDAVTSEAIYRVLRRATEAGVTVFFSSHVLEVVERLCTRMAILRAGRLVAEGTTDEIRAQVGAAPGTPLQEVFVDLVARAEERGSLSWIA